MNGFLLVACMSMEDLPLRLFASESDLREWLRVGEGTFEQVIDEVAKALNWSTNDLLNIAAVEFRDGVPVESKCVMDFTYVWSRNGSDANRV